jgi:hypothetical protein
MRIEEGISSILYHRTSLNALLNIIKSNKILLSSSMGTSADSYGGLYFLSFSRTKNVNLGFSKNPVVTIEFSNLSNNYKGKSIDYWQWPNLTAQKRSESNEYEDRIFSNKPYLENLDRYITHIDIILTDAFRYTNNYNKTLNEIKNSSNILKDRIRVFKDGKDYQLNKFTLIDNIEFSEVQDSGYDFTKRFDLRLLEQVLTIKLINDPKLEDNEYVREYILNYINKFNDLGANVNINDKVMGIVYDIKNKIPYLERDQDFIASMQSNIHNLVKNSTKTEINYEILRILSDEMNKYKVNNIISLIKAKKGEIKDKKLDYSTKYSLGYVSYDKTILIDNNNESSLSWHLLNKYERDKLLDYGYPVTNKNIINYLFNNYTESNAKNLLSKLTPSYSLDTLIDLSNKLIYKELIEKDSNWNISDSSAWGYIDKDDWYSFLYNNLDRDILKNNGKRIIKLLSDDYVRLGFIYAIMSKLMGDIKTNEYFATIDILPSIDDYNRERRYVK